MNHRDFSPVRVKNTVTAIAQFEQPLDQNFLADEIFTSAEFFANELKKATQAFLRACESALILKTEFDKILDVPKERKLLAQQRQQIQEKYGWTQNLVSSFAKIGEFFSEVDERNLELLDIHTIKTATSEKYESVRQQLMSDRLTTLQARQQMANINKALKKPKKPPEIMEWETDKDGAVRLLIRLEDEEAGKELKKQYQESEETCFPFFIRQLLRRPKFEEQIQVICAASPTDVDDSVWQEAQNEVATYIESQAEIQDLLTKINRNEQFLERYASTTCPSERLIVSVCLEENSRHRKRLQELGVESGASARSLLP